MWQACNCRAHACLIMNHDACVATGKKHGGGAGVGVQKTSSTAHCLSAVVTCHLVTFARGTCACTAYIRYVMCTHAICLSAASFRPGNVYVLNPIGGSIFCIRNAKSACGSDSGHRQMRQPLLHAAGSAQGPARIRWEAKCAVHEQRRQQQAACSGESAQQVVAIMAAGELSRAGDASMEGVTDH